MTCRRDELRAADAGPIMGREGIQERGGEGREPRLFHGTVTLVPSGLKD